MKRSLHKILLSLMLVAVSATTAGAQLNKHYFYWVGRNYLVEARYEAAIETLNVLLKVDPDAHEAYFLRGYAKYFLDDLLGAERDFDKAVEINPVYTMAYHYRAITRSLLGNYDDALADFSEAISLRPDLPDSYYSRGVTHLINQRFEEAKADFDQFIRRESHFTDAYVNRGTACLYMKDTVGALANYEQAIRNNRESPAGYNSRGRLYMALGDTDAALADFDKAIGYDPNYMPAYQNRAMLYSETDRPMEAIADLDRMTEIDPGYSLAYFNRALLRSHIGDYNRAIEDFDVVALRNPGNVLVFYYRALVRSILGDFQGAVEDYGRAIELYPDYANAYLGRSRLRYLLRDEAGARQDRITADTKIAEYNARHDAESFSIYADTSRTFNQLLSFDNNLTRSAFTDSPQGAEPVSLLGSFRFTLDEKASPTGIDPHRYYVEPLEIFKEEVNEPMLVFSTGQSAIAADSLVAIDQRWRNSPVEENWMGAFKRGISQTLVRQYTSAINYFTSAIEENPSNPFLYINRATTRAEMIEFISSIDNSYNRINIDADPAGRMKAASAGNYNYDEAIADMNKALRLLPDLAYSWYNRANLKALSGWLPESYDDYSKAIELNPYFAEAYFNRGLIQIYMKDTRKGLLDISKAGELGITAAYQVLRQYSEQPGR